MEIMQLFEKYQFLAVFVSFIIGWACMPLVLKIARAKHFVAKPNKRMSHTGEIPNVGGLDICFSFLFTYVIFEYDMLQQSQFVLFGVLLILAVGFADDVLDLSPLSKLLGETAAGIAIIGFADIRITHLHGFLGIAELHPVASYLLSFFILIAIVNALNLIDGVDGLASGLGILYCLFFAIYFQFAGMEAWAMLAYSLVGALAVFFIYNVFGGKRRRIFMGDSGSLMLGYMLTTFVFIFCEANAYSQVPANMICKAAPAVAVCVLSIPLFDTLRVMITRIVHKKSPLSPDKNHIHHLLLKSGLSHIQTTCVLMTVSLLLILLAWFARNWNIWLLAAVDFIACSLFSLGVIYTSKRSEK